MFTEAKRALRSLGRAPGFAVVAVVTMALAIGSIATIFALVNAVLLKPLPIPGGERVMRIVRVQPPCTDCPISRPALFDWQQGGTEVFEALGGFFGASVTLTGEGDAERLSARRVTPEVWRALAVTPMLGRYFDDEDERQSRNVVVVSHGFWRTRLGAAPNVIGRQLLLNGVPHEVVGVMPAHFTYPGGELWLPTHLPAAATTRGSNYLSVLARLRESVSLERADAVMQAITARQAQEFPDNHEGLSARIVPLRERVSSAVAPALKVLFAAAAVVVLIASVNLANLMLARSQSRRREIALRAAIGGGRLRVVGTLLAEAVAIAAMGVALGLAVAVAAVEILPSLTPDVLPAYNPLSIDAAVVGFVIMVALLSVLAFGVVPALRLAAVAPGAVLAGDSRGGLGGRARSRSQAMLVVTEVALSMVLLAGAALLIESLRRLGRVDPIVDVERVLTIDVSFPTTPTVPGESQQDGFERHIEAIALRIDAVLQRLAALPEVESVAIVDAAPLSGRGNTNSTVTVVGRDAPASEAALLTEWRFVSPNYFRTLGLSVVRGRAFDAGDNRAGAMPTEALVNEAFVRTHLAGVDPIGQRINAFADEPVSIIGVAESARQWGLDREPSPEVYFPAANSFITDQTIVAKTRVAPEQAAASVRRALREAAPDVPVSGLRPMRELIRDGERTRRLFASLMVAFSVIALGLAAVGLYGVIAYSVAQRRNEFGVRMSLGADRRRVLAMVLKQGLGLILVGLAVGLAGALASSRLIAAHLFGVGANDPVVLAAVALALLVTGTTACMVPAWRAARIEPMQALRHD